MKRPHFTKKYVRYRIQDPKKFQKGSFRTVDVGRKGHTKIIVGRPKGKTTTKVQAVIISRKDWDKGYRGGIYLSPRNIISDAYRKHKLKKIR